LGLAGSAEVAEWLSVLIEEELIQPSPKNRLQGAKEYTFRHALVGEATYGLLMASDVTVGHRRAGEFLEAAGEREAATVAGHFERGGDRRRAVTFYLRAADESLVRGDYAGARGLCDRGMGCAPEKDVLGGLKAVHAYAGFFLNTYAGTSDAARAALT